MTIKQSIIPLAVLGGAALGASKSLKWENESHRKLVSAVGKGALAFAAFRYWSTRK